MTIMDEKAVILVEGTGLGLEVLLSPEALGKYLIGGKCEFPLYHHRTEASEVLFGFANDIEKNVFQKLLKVNGVGGKTALAILGLGVDAIVRAINLHDDKLLSGVPWIGKKTAQKIVVELAGSIDFQSFTSSGSTAKNSGNTQLITSLVQMGYDKTRVEETIESLDSSLSIEQKTIEAIRLLSK